MNLNKKIIKKQNKKTQTSQKKKKKKKKTKKTKTLYNLKHKFLVDVHMLLRCALL